MTYLSLFSGVGGFDLALDRVGMKCVGQVEQDKTCLAVLARHWPKVKRINDVRAVTRSTLRRAPDLIVGGFPCQDLSVAGRRDGLAGERSGLFWELHRTIQAFLPGWFLIENVPGLLSSQEGRDFGLVIASLAELGYGVGWRCLDSQYFGLAQRRERVFIVGSLGSKRVCQVLFEPESVQRDSPPSREAGQRIAGTVESRTRGGGFPGTDGACDGHVVHTLRGEGFDASEDGTGRGTPLVAATLRSRQHSPGQSMPGRGGEDDQNLVCIRTNNTGANGHGLAEGVAHTLDSANGQAVYAIQERAVSESDTSGPGGQGYPAAMTKSGVRRLTPRECERLQGFDDDHTRYRADATEISDSARYRMIGNAVSVPVIEWIAGRLAAASSEK